MAADRKYSSGGSGRKQNKAIFFGKKLAPARIFSAKRPFKNNKINWKSVPQPIIFGWRPTQKTKKRAKIEVEVDRRSSFLGEKHFFIFCKIVDFLVDFEVENDKNTKKYVQLDVERRQTT